MPETLAERVRAYLEAQNLHGDKRLFPISYSTARPCIKKLGEEMHLKIRPHDLRRHSATYASRNGVPLEVISKVLLRYQDLKTTQMYLGKISEAEALRWIPGRPSGHPPGPPQSRTSPIKTSGSSVIRASAPL